MDNKYDVVIIGSGPAGLGAAFKLLKTNKKVLLIDKDKISSGGLRNDCKQNYTYPIGFAKEYWDNIDTKKYLNEVMEILKPKIEKKDKLEIYKNRAIRVGVELIEIEQAHVGTDEAVNLINNLIEDLKNGGIDVFLGLEALDIDENKKSINILNKNTNENIEIFYTDLIVAPGRKGASFLQNIMKSLNIEYIDNVVDVGLRLETKIENYSIVKDYYDPKFYFPTSVRTFCTNSGDAHVVQEKYETYYSINGHAYSDKREPNGLVNFAMLRTIKLTDPVASGYQFAKILGEMAMNISGGKAMMQRVGDFRMGKRSKVETFNSDLHNFEPTLKTCTPGDLGLVAPSKILRDIWKSMKMLDNIVPGILHPSTIMYYPEIKTYGNKPNFLNNYFLVKENIYMIGDGAGTSRGITGAWASGIRAVEGILK